MIDGIETRFAEPGDVEAVVAMLRRSLGPAMTSALWRWKHLENPFGPSPVLLAVDATGIAAVRPFMRWQWASGTDLVPAVRAVDTATRSDWRRRSLFSRLTQELLEHVGRSGAEFVFNTPNRNSLPGYLRLGWKRVTQVPLWIAPRPLRLVRRTLGPGPAAGAETPSGLPGGSVPELLEDPDLGPFLEGLGGRFDRRYSTRPTLSYLRWRYDRVPHQTYRALWRLEGRRGAVLLFRTSTRGRFSEILVSEVLVSDRDAGMDAGAALLKMLKRGSAVDYAAAVAPRTSLAGEALHRAGFLHMPRLGPRLTVRPLASGTGRPDPLRWRSWCCSLGDLEIF